MREDQQGVLEHSMAKHAAKRAKRSQYGLVESARDAAYHHNGDHAFCPNLLHGRCNTPIDFSDQVVLRPLRVRYARSVDNTNPASAAFHRGHTALCCYGNSRPPRDKVIMPQQAVDGAALASPTRPAKDEDDGRRRRCIAGGRRALLPGGQHRGDVLRACQRVGHVCHSSSLFSSHSYLIAIIIYEYSRTVIHCTIPVPGV